MTKLDSELKNKEKSIMIIQEEKLIGKQIKLDKTNKT
jgi:hypothetical protein